MEHIKLFESYFDREITLTSRSGRSILFKVVGGKISGIDNRSGMNFPFSENQPYNRNVETWACNNGFMWKEGNSPEKDPCPEKKIFGVKISDVPKGHEWRRIFPNKFR